MATHRRIAWDACAWIAHISQEKVTLPDGTIEDRGAMCLPVLEQARQRQIEIATSGMALAEVCKSPGADPNDKDLLEDFFRQEFIVLVPVDRHVGSLARNLMMDRHAGLKPADATYIAAALVAHAAELHTFDGPLLALDGRVERLDGGVLKICKPPRPMVPPPSLLDGMGPLYEQRRALELDGDPDNG